MMFTFNAEDEQGQSDNGCHYTYITKETKFSHFEQPWLQFEGNCVPRCTSMRRTAPDTEPRF